jgi:Flp pilus assembly protein TadG
MVVTMALKTFVEKLRKTLRAFRSAERGNVIMTFALATIPIIGFVGAAVDYSRGNSAKAALQMANDATALMLSKDASNLNTSQLSQKASDYFMAVFNRSEVTNLVITPIYSSPQQGSSKLVVTVTANVPTMFMKIFGHEKMDLNVSSEVLWGMKKLELALALDNTGSMSSASKMTELKKAAHALLDTLKKAASKPGDVKVAIIPFDTTVNIGTSYKDQPWFDVSCSALGSPPGCTNSNWKNYWEGCVRDRTYPNDTTDAVPSSAATQFPIYDCGSLTKILPLTSDWTALNAKVDAMTPNGNTNVTIGLAWGWHALTNSAPLSEAAAPAPDLDKVLIILTDGTNTESWKNSNNTKVTSAAAIDLRTALACTNIKAANIKIYAVRVINGNASLLKNCATNPTMYFDVQSASQLNAVFTTIAQNLANLRIAK